MRHDCGWAKLNTGEQGFDGNLSPSSHTSEVSRRCRRSRGVTCAVDDAAASVRTGAVATLVAAAGAAAAAPESCIVDVDGVDGGVVVAAADGVQAILHALASLRSSRGDRQGA